MPLDFLKPAKRLVKGTIQIYPKFIVRKSEDLMIRGSDFYAIWNEDTHFWSTDEDDAIALIDRELDIYAEQVRKVEDKPIVILHLWDSESGMIDLWHKYCKQQRRDFYHSLDEYLMFDNSECKKTDYASKKLKYALAECDIPCWTKMTTTLYAPEELHKIEWAIGSIVAGESRHLQKFCVFYGDSGTGKSTIMNVIEDLFEGYTASFDAKSLGSASASFALEQFKSNPLVGIQQDGDLSRIEDNTRLNSLVSHEKMTVNMKYHSAYEDSFKTFLFMGTNRPVKITDSKSGILRRLIDITPTGEKIPYREYMRLKKGMKFELGGIAWHCKQVFEEDPDYYNNYVPTRMMSSSNDFYNFILDNFFEFKEKDQVTLKDAWDRYKAYCDEALVQYRMTQRVFKEELKAYFKEFYERVTNGSERARSVYKGFKTDKFVDAGDVPSELPKVSQAPSWLSWSDGYSKLDEMLQNCPAQYANRSDKPVTEWASVSTKLADIDTSRTHYVIPPSYHVVVDFDIKENGEKSLDRNIEAASKFPPTYAEVSKSGKGLHLHYNYTGDITKLSAVYADGIEIKVFTGLASLRRKLSLHNDYDIMTIASGLPLKEGKKMINFKGVADEKHLRAIIEKHLRKEIVPNTAPSMGLIFSTIEQMYKSGKPYDISDMRPSIMAFAINSTHQADECIKIYNKIHWCSEEEKSVDIPNSDDQPIVFYDVETFPNLFLISWKFQGAGQKIVHMFNPTPEQVKELFKFRLIGYNCRRYDNHMIYARYLGKSTEELFELSQRIISGSKNGFFKEAYNISYTDVYDFCSKKQSLKKWEIELGITHKELGFQWDQAVPEDKWPQVAEYCGYDVEATEATFDANKGDWEARLILAEWAEMIPNSTTNQLTTRIIFGKDERNTRSELQWRDMGDMSDAKSDLYFKPDGSIDEYTVFDKQNRPIFPGYRFDMGKSWYRDEDPKEGGYVYSEPGIYINVALLDIASMHPSSAIAENLFGKYTKNFQNIKDLRVMIKHKDFDAAKRLVPDRIAKYLEDVEMADRLAYALKIAINSVYGLTSAKFENAFHDSRNKDNIVAKRGALFMINLKHHVQEHGYSVMHIKTDSIKIPNADLNVIKLISDYGRLYGYTFEHEATYERICLVNDAVYIAKYASLEDCVSLYGEEYINSSKEVVKENKKHPLTWTATGAQFAVPYVFKTLFSKEELEFQDFCETKQVTSALYLNFNESGQDNYQFVGKIGLFCPVLPGTGGGDLCRLAETKTGEIKYDSAVGCKGYKWRQAVDVKTEHLESTIDKSYYIRLVDEAKATIAEAGSKTGYDIGWFLPSD
jgi:phage/plasmid-associated DNA primase